jgi:hypothetical protein
MLRISLQVGPLFCAISAMVKELGLFLLMWLFEVIVGFAVLNMIITFLRVEEQSPEGGFDISGLLEVAKFGGSPLSIALFYAFFAVNLVIFANCVTAILIESYIRLKKESRATHALNLFEVIPILIYNEKYSGIVAALPPFNLLNLLIQLPLICCCKENGSKKCSSVTMFFLYLPVALLLTIFFIFANLTLLPFGYVYGLYAMITRPGKLSCGLRAEWLLFIFVGPVILLLNFVTCDLYYFIKSLYWTPKLQEKKETLLNESLAGILFESVNDYLVNEKDNMKPANNMILTKLRKDLKVP